ncbi:hypothetical protein FRX31_013184 [Thalictrum thalictroides]|uniref:Uncharacterized protein n=1 Tax=Thalictrum thalictroides TaxID=46969 RepID=A0A7J6WIN2_THATH|nr:hypothetical protein FRX31_013184 [Thalictrum thalictroides]
MASRTVIGMGGKLFRRRLSLADRLQKNKQFPPWRFTFPAMTRKLIEATHPEKYNEEAFYALGGCSLVVKNHMKDIKEI